MKCIPRISKEESKLETWMPISLIAVFLIFSPLLVGCVYRCHYYNNFEEVIEEGGWQITGDIGRYHAEGTKVGLGSWPHWRARNDDRYSLEFIPVTSDSMFWADGEVDFVNVTIIAGNDTILINWLDRETLYENYKAREGPSWYAYKEETKCLFVSDYFAIRKPVPNTLIVEYEFLVIDSATKEVRSRWTMKSKAEIDRHTRWIIVDAIES